LCDWLPAGITHSTATPKAVKRGQNEIPGTFSATPSPTSPGGDFPGYRRPIYTRRFQDIGPWFSAINAKKSARFSPRSPRISLPKHAGFELK
jgi:hypothetical protein